MGGFFSLAEAAVRFAAAARATEEAKAEIIEAACKMVAAKAKGAIGTYEFGWTPLQSETVARKANGDTPLLETGELRASIEWTAEKDVGYVGSNNDKAVWQELGTSRGIPPRPFLMTAAMLEGEHIAKMAAETLGAAFEAGLAGHELMHILHIAKEAAKDLKEAGEDFLESDESKNGNRR